VGPGAYLGEGIWAPTGFHLDYILPGKWVTHGSCTPRTHHGFFRRALLCLRSGNLVWVGGWRGQGLPRGGISSRFGFQRGAFSDVKEGRVPWFRVQVAIDGARAGAGKGRGFRGVIRERAWANVRSKKRLTWNGWMIHPREHFAQPLGALRFGPDFARNRKRRWAKGAHRVGLCSKAGSKLRDDKGSSKGGGEAAVYLGGRLKRLRSRSNSGEPALLSIGTDVFQGA